MLFREGLRLFLESRVTEPAVEIIEAGDFHTALAHVHATSDLDLALVDLTMPGMDGFIALDTIRRAAPRLLVIVVSASEAPEDVRRALAAGARGYICKSSGGESMVRGIDKVLAGKSYVCPHLEIAAAPVAAECDKEYAALRSLLTPRQRHVLAMLREGKANKEIARDLDLAEITVKLHVTAILRTLAVENRTQAAILAAKMGL